jgi:CubicO group peptidase (beta-lactamase class C family)
VALQILLILPRDARTRIETSPPALPPHWRGDTLPQAYEGDAMTGSKSGALMVAAGLMILAASSAQADSLRITKIQAALDAWLADRNLAEKVTGVAGYISFGDIGPAMEVYAGKVGSGPQDVPVRQGTLFQMGSTSKSFTAALILKLEAAGTLSIYDTLGKWLPQYPAWKDVTIQRLLNMTSGIPNYSETEAMFRIWVDDPTRDLTSENLIALAYPTGSGDLPKSFLRDAKHKLLAVAGEPVIESDVTPVCPAEVLQGFSEGRKIDLPNLVVFGEAHNHADTPHPVALLCASGLRPDRRTAE